MQKHVHGINVNEAKISNCNSVAHSKSQPETFTWNLNAIYAIQNKHYDCDLWMQGSMLTYCPSILHHCFVTSPNCPAASDMSEFCRCV